MSATLRAFAIDIDRLRAVFGSKDAALVAAVKAKQAAAFARNRKWFGSEIEDGALTLEVALDEIVAGKITGDRSSGFQYGNATELLCVQLGEELESECLGSLTDLELETGLQTSGSPLPTPAPEDFPEIGFLTSTQVHAELAQLKADHGEDDDLAEVQGELISHLERATELGTGLVTFAS
jgi:hypothetical protein